MSQARIYLHTLYERLWHWWQAFAITALLVTGLEIHAPQTVGLLGFETAIWVHDILGLLLVLNAGLGLFYALTTGEIRNYLPEPRDFVSLAMRQVVYYTKGVFQGAPHPIAKTRDKRLNPLQRVTYLAILNVLLPLQVATGLLMWGAKTWPGVVAPFGGLGALGLLHTAAAWAFGAFVVMHVYLTTTSGPRWSSGLVGMITGWEEVESTSEERAP